MTDDNTARADKAAYNEANSAAHTLSRDAGMKAKKGPVDATAGDRKPGDVKGSPHSGEGSGPKALADIPCPRCGEETLRAEFPDPYETWIKCSSCRFFMGMSHDDWHRVENSPNICEKIKKMALKKGVL